MSPAAIWYAGEGSAVGPAMAVCYSSHAAERGGIASLLLHHCAGHGFSFLLRQRRSVTVDLHDMAASDGWSKEDGGGAAPQGVQRAPLALSLAEHQC